MPAAMKRWMLIFAAVAGVAGSVWALKHPASTTSPAQAQASAAAAEGEPKSCCQKAPSRLSLLSAKPEAKPGEAAPQAQPAAPKE